MASTLFDYYQSIGKSLPTSLSGRFSDPTFADAARRAGVSQGSYTGSAAQNTAILTALNSIQSPMGSAISTPAPSAAPSSRTTTGATQSQNNQNSSRSTNTPPLNTGTGSQAYLTGDYALVRFTGQGQDRYMNDQTIWLLDPKTKTLRPFSGGASLANFFDGEVNADDIIEIDARELQPGGSLGSNGGKPGYQLLSPEYAIQRDGSARKLDYSAAELATRYGQPVNEEMEQTMFSALKGVFNMLEQAGISKNTINKIKGNDELMAFYVSAMAYGGYSVGDIYSEVKKRELGINNISPISATADKVSYAATSDYQKAAADPRVQPPSEMAGMNSAQLGLAIYNLPDEAFKTLVPLLDYDSQEFKDAMASVETSYYDLLEQQLRASTEQEKAIADYNYQEWKADVERNFGITLSDNALEAWNQIQQVYNQGAQTGTFGSGLQNEGIDSYLRSVRRQDQRARTERLSGEEKQQMQYYLTAASTQEIKDLVNSDPEKAKRWGLVPSDEVKNALSLPELKRKYPNAKEEDLAQYISILLDENGNYRSQIYQKQMGTLGDLDPNSASMNTLTGLNTNREQFQIGETYRKELLKEEDAYKEFTQPDVAFLRNSDPKAFENVTGKKATPETENLSKIISKAGSNITPSTSYTAPTTSGSTNNSSTLAALQKQLADAQALYKAKTGSEYKPPAPVTPSAPTNNSSQLAILQKQLADAQALYKAKTGTTYTPPKVTTPTVSTPAYKPPSSTTTSKTSSSPSSSQAASMMAQLQKAQADLNKISSSKSSTTSSTSSTSSKSSMSAADRARATRLANGAKR